MGLTRWLVEVWEGCERSAWEGGLQRQYNDVQICYMLRSVMGEDRGTGSDGKTWGPGERSEVNSLSQDMRGRGLGSRRTLKVAWCRARESKCS